MIIRWIFAVMFLPLITQANAQSNVVQGIDDVGTVLNSPVGQNGVTARWMEFYSKPEFSSHGIEVGSGATLDIGAIVSLDKEWPTLTGRSSIDGFMNYDAQREAISSGQFSEHVILPGSLDDLYKDIPKDTYDFYSGGILEAKRQFGARASLVGCSVTYVKVGEKTICMRTCSDAQEWDKAFGIMQ